MKRGDYFYDAFEREFPIVLQMVRDRSVNTFTKTEFIDVWNTVATVRMSESFLFNKLNELCEFGLLSRERVKGVWQYR